MELAFQVLLFWCSFQVKVKLRDKEKQENIVNNSDQTNSMMITFSRTFTCCQCIHSCKTHLCGFSWSHRHCAGGRDVT